MILRSLRLRRVLYLFCAVLLTERKEEERVATEDILNDEDWQVLTELVVILRPLYRLTKRFEGNAYLQFDEVLPHLYLLQRDMKELQGLYLSDEEHRAARIQDVIFIQASKPDIDTELDAEDLPEPMPTIDTPAPSRPCRRTRLPTRLDDYLVKMPALQQRTTAAHQPTEDIRMEDDAPELLTSQGKEVIRRSI